MQPLVSCACSLGSPSLSHLLHSWTQTGCNPFDPLRADVARAGLNYCHVDFVQAACSSALLAPQAIPHSRTPVAQTGCWCPPRTPPQDQLERSKAAQKGLETSLQTLEVQKRVLQVQLERRDTLVRDMAGVPRAARPASASRYMEVAVADEIGFGPDARQRPAHALQTQGSMSASGDGSRSGSLRRPQSARSLFIPGSTAQQGSSSSRGSGPVNARTQAALSAVASSTSPPGPGQRAGTGAGRPGSAPASRLGRGGFPDLPPSLLPAPVMEGSAVVGPVGLVRGTPQVSGESGLPDGPPCSTHACPRQALLLSFFRRVVNLKLWEGVGCFFSACVKKNGRKS